MPNAKTVVPAVSIPTETEEVVTKVKLKKDGGFISYVTFSPKDDRIESTISLKDKPHADLPFSMDRLINIVINAVHLDPLGWNDATVSGLTITEEGLVITAQAKEFQACVNTPLLKIEDMQQSDQFLIRLVEKEAKAYLQGKREQMSLPL